MKQPDPRCVHRWRLKDPVWKPRKKMYRTYEICLKCGGERYTYQPVYRDRDTRG